MTKIMLDQQAINEVLSRGVEKIYPSRGLLEKKLLSGDKLRLYCGYDPSAPALHIGNAITMLKLSAFQSLGHEVIFLIGSLTGQIGDPTDKTAARKKLTKKQVLENAKGFAKQAGKYLDFKGANAVKIKYNGDWGKKLNFEDLIELASNFTVQQMIQRDMFQERLKAERPIYLHEFLYPLAQAYDSVVMDVDLEVGGNDQMFNMMCGRDLMKTLSGKEKCVLTLKLLTDSEGKKMGKSEGNMVNLTETATEMFGKIMSWPDAVLINAFELCTRLPMNEIENIKKQLQNNLNPRDAKLKLATEIVKINHGDKKAQLAKDDFINTFQKKEIPEAITTITIADKELNIIDLIIKAKLTESRGEAKRLIEQHGIKLKHPQTDFTIISHPNYQVKITKGLIIQKGKRFFVKIV